MPLLTNTTGTEDRLLREFETDRTELASFYSDAVLGIIERLDQALSQALERTNEHRGAI